MFIPPDRTSLQINADFFALLSLKHTHVQTLFLISPQAFFCAFFHRVKRKN